METGQTNQSDEPGAREKKRLVVSASAPEAKNNRSSKSGSSQTITCSSGSSSAARVSDQLEGMGGLSEDSGDKRGVIAAAEEIRQSETPTATESGSTG